ncbi:hypothetical protein GMMP13_420027 [Candidatus Magnetomoraceae bacterium gMMP-13]
MTGKNFIIILLVILLAFAMVNLYIFQPALTLKLSKPEKLAPEQKSSPAVRNVLATTMEKIKVMFPKKQLAKTSQLREVKRNPFLWSDEVIDTEKEEARIAEEQKALEEKLKKQKITEIKKPTLSMIIIGENQKMALLDNVLVFEGSRLNKDHTVQRISRKKVILNGEYGTMSVLLPEYSLNPDEKAPKEEFLTKKKTAKKAPDLLKTISDQNELAKDLLEKIEPLLQNE